MVCYFASNMLWNGYASDGHVSDDELDNDDHDHVI